MKRKTFHSALINIPNRHYPTQWGKKTKTTTTTTTTDKQTNKQTKTFKKAGIKLQCKNKKDKYNRAFLHLFF